ncbi:MAG: exonuclease SbcCD subunit D C-terminal domain-containing protein [Synergistaceae bacterium]|nr:exonuclease SbcCD subunit D C-terminal domain-containing protein [Synergistaceae bacterium]
MRILHTSDWHIGKKLMEHERLDEFRKFFAWLEDVIQRKNIDALVVAGDIFDNGKPSTDSQEIYYTFLGRVAGKSCRHIIITSGNHDSPQFIDAPSEIMSRCDIHVIGRASDDEIITLRDSNGSPEMIVCAVPFLHDSDIRTAKAEDKFQDIERQIKAGIANHYAEIFTRAREIRGGYDIPIIAMGHLFLEAGKTYGEEGERNAYLGTAIKLGSDIFPEDIAYTALGHLHSPQNVGRENIRYSGSPITLSFGEWDSQKGQKSVSVVDFDGRNFAGVKEIAVPVSQKMARVAGDTAGIETEIRRLVEADESVWIEVTYTGDVKPENLQERLEDIVKGSKAEILSVKSVDRHKTSDSHGESSEPISIDDIKPLEMLKRYCDENNITEETRQIFIPLYVEILKEMGLDG